MTGRAHPDALVLGLGGRGLGDETSAEAARVPRASRNPTEETAAYVYRMGQGILRRVTASRFARRVR